MVLGLMSIRCKLVGSMQWAWLKVHPVVVFRTWSCITPDVDVWIRYSWGDKGDILITSIPSKRLRLLFCKVLHCIVTDTAIVLSIILIMTLHRQAISRSKNSHCWIFSRTWPTEFHVLHGTFDRWSRYYSSMASHRAAHPSWEVVFDYILFIKHSRRDMP